MTVAMPALLIVEDSPPLRTFLSVTLKRLNVRHYIAASCSEAVSLLRDHPTISGVLLDVQLPDKDGPETLTVLRSIVPGLPAVYMTGDPGELPPNHGALGVLAKPFGMGELGDAVRMLAVGG